MDDLVVTMRVCFKSKDNHKINGLFGDNNDSFFFKSNLNDWQQSLITIELSSEFIRCAEMFQITPRLCLIFIQPN